MRSETKVCPALQDMTTRGCDAASVHTFIINYEFQDLSLCEMVLGCGSSRHIALRWIRAMVRMKKTVHVAHVVLSSLGVRVNVCVCARVCVCA